MESVADIIRERGSRLFANAVAAREQGKIEHALKLANLASHILKEAEAAEAAEATEATEATSASIATQNGLRPRP
jgi:hypothetical protein